MEMARVRYELRVGTVVSPAMLAAFRVPITHVAVPGNTVHRLRISADRDLTEVVHRLIERDIELLGIRRAPAAPPPTRRPPAEPAPAEEADVVVPFPSARAASGREPGPARPRRSRRPGPAARGGGAAG